MTSKMTTRGETRRKLCVLRARLIFYVNYDDTHKRKVRSRHGGYFTRVQGSQGLERLPSANKHTALRMCALTSHAMSAGSRGGSLLCTGGGAEAGAAVGLTSPKKSIAACLLGLLSARSPSFRSSSSCDSKKDCSILS